MQSVLDQTTLPGASMTASRRYQVAVEKLQLGMFVVELDRPWLDTPFLLQGFLIDSKVELDTLVKYCDYVYIDLELSLPELADTIRRVEVRALKPDAAAKPRKAGSKLQLVDAGAERTPGSPDAAADGAPAAGSDADELEAAPFTRAPAPAAPRRNYQPRADVKISQLTRQRFRHFVRQAGEAGAGEYESRLGRWFGRIFNRAEQEPGARSNKPPPPVTADLLPEGVVRTHYEERHTMLEELPRARLAFSGGESAMAEVMSTIRSGKPLQFDRIEAAVEGIVQSMAYNPDALMWIARLREEDVNTYNHGVRVALYLVALGRHLGLPRQELNYLGEIGMLGDLGKSKLPRAILEKPGMLSPGEFELVKQHVNLTLQLLASAPNVPPAVFAGIAQHHERVDGSGYPNRLKGKEIGVYGKMAAIADSYAALITPRAYANASAPQDALMNLYEWSGTSFHEPMVEQFVQAIGVFPVGSMIELTAGEIAVVVAHNRVRRLEPKVLVLSNTDKTPLPQPVERDLFKEAKVKGGQPSRIARGLPAGAFGFKLRDYYLDESAKSGGASA